MSSNIGGLCLCLCANNVENCNIRHHGRRRRRRQCTQHEFDGNRWDIEYTSIERKGEEMYRRHDWDLFISLVFLSSIGTCRKWNGTCNYEINFLSELNKCIRQFSVDDDDDEDKGTSY